MKLKSLLLLSLSLIQISFVSAQSPVQSAKQDVSLKIASNVGTNGLAVAFNPKKGLYYSVFAGNEAYMIEVHDLTGKSLYKMQIGADLRGFWYNESKNQLQGILYNNLGSCTFDLDGNGYPKGININKTFYTLDANDIACFNANKVYFLNGNGICEFKYGKNKSTTKASKPYSYPDCMKDLGIDELNLNGFFHTGIKGYEIGIYNFETGKLLLVDIKTGKTTAEITLNLSEENTSITRFNVSFCNEHVFLFNSATRVWSGFKIFS